MTFNDTIIEELSKPLDSRHVKPAPPGKHGDYIEGWHVIAEANRIFGFDGWSYEIIDLKQTASSENHKGNYVVGYLARVKTIVHGITREDVGHGSGTNKSEADAHEGAIKEAVTDGLKRALRTFGNPFGLALYDKSKENVVDQSQISAYGKAKSTLSERLKSCKTLDDVKVVSSNEKFVNYIKPFPDKVKADLKDMIKKRQDEIKNGDASRQAEPIEAILQDYEQRLEVAPSHIILREIKDEFEADDRISDDAKNDLNDQFITLSESMVA